MILINQLGQLLLKSFQIFKVAIDAGEADVRDIVEFTQAIHDAFADVAGVDFFAHVGHVFFQAV